MKYSDFREQIKSGDIIAFAGNSIGAKAIRWWTKEEYSHVALAWRYGRHVMLIEAEPLEGVRVRPLSKALITEPIVHHYSQPYLYWNDNVEDFAIKQWGALYGFNDCWMAAIGKPPIKDGKFQCAELCYETMVFGAVPMIVEKPTPGSLILEMIKHGSIKTVLEL